jgi:hypothetical protein
LAIILSHGISNSSKGGRRFAGPPYGKGELFGAELLAIGIKNSACTSLAAMIK